MIIFQLIAEHIGQCEVVIVHVTLLISTAIYGAKRLRIEYNDYKIAARKAKEEVEKS
jgi:hypothetical protein